jgi:hypothetical protein
MADKKQFSNTKSVVKVETGIVTLIWYRHYLKIVGNNKLWPDMQKESWKMGGAYPYMNLNAKYEKLTTMFLFLFYYDWSK